MEEVPLFRAPKRRKVIKPPHVESDATTPTTSQDRDGSPIDGEQSGNEAYAPAHRLKKPFKPSRPGVTFTSNARTRVEAPDTMTVVPSSTADDRLKDISNRFVGITGGTVDVDKHMMAYIDSEMAKRRQMPTTAAHSTETEPISVEESTEPRLPASALVAASQSYQPQHQPHQLSEVPLPPTTTESKPPPRRQRKPRLGRDGKPMRPRRPKRRDSSDLARDALVEQVLHEHKLEHYSSTPPPPTPQVAASQDPTLPRSGIPANTAASSTVTSQEQDEAFALRFQHEFEERLAERQAMQPQRRKEAGDKDKEKSGPRLGGSRSARAKMVAMREAEKAKTGR